MVYQKSRKSKISKNQWYAVLFLTIVLGVILVALIAKRDEDAFDYTIRGKDFSLSGAAAQTIDPDYGVRTISDIQEDTVTLGVGNVVLAPGTYTYDLQYALEGADVSWSIYSGGYLSENNQSGKVWPLETFSETESSAYGSFEIDKYLEDVEFSFIIPRGATFSLSRLTLQSETVRINDSYIFMGLTVLIYLLLLFFLFKKRELCRPTTFHQEQISGRRMCFFLIFAMAVTAVFSSMPLFSEDLAGGYDILYHVNRIEGIAKSLAGGQFPVRIHPGILNGYGYPNGIFYPELFLYFPACLRLLGMSLMNSYKVFVVAVSFATVAISYVAFSKLLQSRMAGILAAVLYTINPYRLACVYEKSAVGEYLAMAFLPAVFYGMYAVLCGEKKDWKWLCLGACGVLQSHILTTEITAFFCLVVAVFAMRPLFGAERRWIPLLKATIWTVLLNLWFLVPFLLMTFQLNVSVFGRNPQLSINTITFFNELFSLIYLRQLRKNDGGLSNNGLGFVFLFALALLVIYIVLHRVPKKGTAQRRLLSLGIVLAFIGTFTAFAATDLFPWEEIQSIHFISKIVGSLQFPCRLFSITMTCFSVVAGVVLLLWTKEREKRAVVVIVTVSVAAFSANLYLDYTNAYAQLPHIAQQHQFSVETSTFSGIALGEYVPQSSSVLDILTRGTDIKCSSSDIRITALKRDGLNFSFDFVIDNYQPEEAYSLLAPLTYYPSYRATINGISYNAVAGGNNYVEINLPEESGHVELGYRQPRTFVIATIISVGGCLWFIVDSIRPKWYVKMGDRMQKRFMRKK